MRTSERHHDVPGRSPRPWRLPVVLAALVLGAVIAGVGAATTSRTAVAPSNTALPVITGVAQEGQAVTATTGTWSGDAPITYGFQWQRCDASGSSCGNIDGATGQQYVLTSADTGRTVRVVVIATNASGSASAGSSPTGVVSPPGAAPSATRQPNPQGRPDVGRSVSVDNGSWAGTAPFTFTHQWQRCQADGGNCASIPGATGSSYVVQPADAGFRLRAIVTATNPIGSASIASNLTAVVGATAAGTPVNTSRPSVPGGRILAGTTITGGAGTWTGAQPIALDFQWNRCDAGGRQCRAIPGATAATYGVTAADVGARLQFAVRASNAAGAANAVSRVTNVVERSGQPEGAIRLPGGGTSIPASSVGAPERLVISRVMFSPNPVRSRTTFTARFRVTDTRGFVVRDALVFAIGLPYSWFTAGSEVRTGTDGWATIRITPTRAVPGGRAAGVFFVRARKAGDSLLAGVSTRRLVQVSIRVPR